MVRSVHKEVTCPFCSLLCDDLEVEHSGNGLHVLKNGCSKARDGFEQPPAALQPCIKGNAVTLDKAVEETARLLGRAKRPLISGLGSDVAGARAVMPLAERTRAVVDHCLGEAAVRNMLVLQERGWITTTLTEVKNRADFILFVGTDAVSRYPRFFERYVWNESSLFLEKAKERRIAYLGRHLNTRPGISPAGVKPLAIHCETEELTAYLSLLLALMKGLELQPESIPRRKLAQLRTLAQQLRDANYGVVVWSPGDLDVAHGELIVEAAGEVIRELNHSGRCAGLSLAGDHGTASFMNVCAWQSGYPLRVSYERGVPEHDAYNFSAAQLLQRRQVDALLWIASFGLEPPVPDTALPTIVLGAPSTTQKADVFIPVGTPGLDHAGNLFRTDSVVALPLKDLQRTGLPSVAAVLERITEALP
jgi:formylmethanofuran dehydrogenase subunit B